MRNRDSYPAKTEGEISLKDALLLNSVSNSSNKARKKKIKSDMFYVTIVRLLIDTSIEIII